MVTSSGSAGQPVAYSGTVNLGRPVADAVVVAQTLDGAEIARTTTSASGSFVLPNVAPTRFRIVATSRELGLTLASEVDGRAEDDRYVVLNVPTTLVSRYLQAHPGEALASAEARFRSAVGIPQGVNLGYGIEESARSPFSHLNFFARAAAAGGIEPFIEQQIAALDAAEQEGESGTESVFRIKSDDLRADLAGLQPALAEFLRGLQQDRTLVLSVTTDLVEGVLGFIGQEAASSVLDAGIDTGWTKFAEQVGLNFGTSTQLDHIEGQLNQVLAGITDLKNQINNGTYLTLAGQLSDEVAFIEALSSDGDGTTTQGGIAEPYGVEATLRAFGAPTDQPRKPNTTVGSFIGSLVGFQMAQALTNMADQQDTMNSLWRSVKVDAEIGTSVSANQGNFPVRSNYWVARSLQNYKFYSTFQELATNWLIEQARQSNQMGDALNGALPTMQSVAAALRRQRGQLPPYLLSDDVLVDLNAGLIWSLQTQGPSTYDDAVTFAKDYKIQSTTPNGVVVSLGSWRIPTHEEVEFLRDRARYATGAIPGTATPADSTDGPGDYGQVTQGLQRLGFKNVREAFTSSSNGGDAEDGGVWYRSWKTPWSSDYLYRLSKRTEIQLNHESGKEAYKGDSDKRPFLMCRQIFSVLNNVNEPGGAGGDGSFYTDTPSELKPKSLPAEWYPGLGVITGVSQPGAITVEKVATTITYAVNTGHAVTIGDTVSRNAGSDDQTLANSRTYEGTVFTFPQNFVWFTTPPGSPLTVSNLPAAYPARDSSGNPVTYPLALNRPGTAGSQIWNTSDGTTTFEVPVTANVVGYDGTNFPVVLSSTNTIRQVATNNSGQPRRPTRAQVSPRNRVYDSTFTNSPIASETYGLTVFFDNKTVESKTADASWEIVSMVNSSDGTPYTGGGISVSNVGSDEGLLQVTLASVPTTGVDFQVKATVVVDGVTLSDTVKARVIGTP